MGFYMLIINIFDVTSVPSVNSEAVLRIRKLFVRIRIRLFNQIVSGSGSYPIYEFCTHFLHQEFLLKNGTYYCIGELKS
jgi:hypothetical protein